MNEQKFIFPEIDASKEILEYTNTLAQIEIEQKKGRLIIFPSYLLHKVTPIKSGTRRSLVTWVNGPHFK
jgi:PKHD-type hydroxylase